jgi:uncharacterized paraquat-inducible protein A
MKKKKKVLSSNLNFNVKTIKIKPIKPMAEMKEKDEQIIFKRPCQRCEEIFRPSSKMSRICPNCHIKSRERINKRLSNRLNKLLK